MKSHRFEASVELPVAAQEAYEWHTRRGTLNRLTPAWGGARVVGAPEAVRNGSTALLQVRAGPFRFDWEALHRDCIPARQFIDEQARGPFDRWVHRHRFEPLEECFCRLTDEIDYVLPGGSVGDAFASRPVASRLRELFAWRHAVTRADLERRPDPRATAPARIAISGASGFIGTTLVPFFEAAGHRVVRLVRRPANPERDEISWDPTDGRWAAKRLSGFDAVVHLAGKSIAGGRWTSATKAEILRSRVAGTGQLAEALAALDDPPKALFVASAIGTYGDRGDAEVDEASPPGTGFLADVCRAWEAASDPAARRGIRVVHLRFGVVLGAGGGALAKMLPPFRLGLGGKIGTGRQWMSWVALDDVLGAISFALFRPELSGPVNVVAPQPVRNEGFARALGRVLERPAVVPLPTPAVRLLFGEMGREALLAGQHVVSRRLHEAGFRFQHADLERALRFELGRMIDR